MAEASVTPRTMGSLGLGIIQLGSFNQWHISICALLTYPSFCWVGLGLC